MLPSRPSLRQAVFMAPATETDNIREIEKQFLIRQFVMRPLLEFSVSGSGGGWQGGVLNERKDRGSNSDAISP